MVVLYKNRSVVQADCPTCLAIVSEIIMCQVWRKRDRGPGKWRLSSVEW